MKNILMLFTGVMLAGYGLIGYLKDRKPSKPAPPAEPEVPSFAPPAQ